MPLIIFDGMDGAGKSTQISKIADKLNQMKIPYIVTREPGGTPFGEHLRDSFISEKPTPWAEVLLMLSIRAEHVAQKIRPALKDNIWVLCDRFIDSTYVYQCFLQNLPKKDIDSIAQLFMNDILPELSFIFTTSPKITKDRLLERNQKLSRFDTFDSLKFEQIKDTFSFIVKHEFTYPSGKIPHRILVDGTGTPDEVFAFLWENLSKKFPILKELSELP
jgi:dTMP kinase